MLGLALKECQAYAALGGFAQSFSVEPREKRNGESFTIDKLVPYKSIRAYPHTSLQILHDLRSLRIECYQLRK